MPKFKNTILLTFILTFGVLSYSLGQVTDENIRGIVLRKGIKDSLFIFDFSRPNDHNETQLKYLGILKSKDGRAFKIMSYCWIWGLSKRATNRILIYDRNNRYLGNYKLDMKYELPQKIENNELFFNVKDDKNAKSVQTRISFAKGLPRQIFIENGNLYIFHGD
jgi:hypothetical protein